MTTPYIEAKKAESRAKFKEFCSFDGVEIDGDVGAFLDTLIDTLLDEIESKVVPDEMTMEAALKAGSDAGAGYTIGHNYSRKDVKEAFQHLRTGVESN